MDAAVLGAASEMIRNPLDVAYSCHIRRSGIRNPEHLYSFEAIIRLRELHAASHSRRVSDRHAQSVAFGVESFREARNAAQLVASRFVPDYDGTGHMAYREVSERWVRVEVRLQIARISL